MSTWILLRGLTREAQHWGDFPKLLQAAYPEMQVVALELPGNGVRHAEPSPTTVRELAAHCHAEAARLGLQSQEAERQVHALTAVHLEVQAREELA